MIDIGSNLDRVTCWQDRTGLNRAAEEEMSLLEGIPGDSEEDEDNVGCEFLRKEVERDDCWRKQAAKVASIVLLTGGFSIFPSAVY